MYQCTSTPEVTPVPNRIIKESAFTSEKVAELSDFEFRLWVGLITQADDAGRGDARPAIIKGRIFPLRERVSLSDIDKALHAMAACGCVSLYTVGGKPYYMFPNWAAHQRVRDAKPKYPAPDDSANLAANCGDSPRTAATCGLNPIQSNPIRIQSESESESNARTRAEAAFADFWSAYPKKVGKGAALKAFKKLKASAYPLLVPAIERQKRSAQWQKDGGQYIPNPATWLNQERWLDEGTDEQDGRPGYRAQPHNGTLGEYERAAVERLMNG